MLHTPQIQSFEAELSIPEIAAKEGGPPSFRGVFIRAPAILDVGPGVEVLADIPVSFDKASPPDLSIQGQEVCFNLSCYLVFSPKMHTGKYHARSVCDDCWWCGSAGVEG